MKETIVHMLKVEAEAKEIVAAAQAEAAELVRGARAQAVSIQEEARRNAQTTSANMLEAGVDQARMRRDERLAEIDAKNERLRRVPPEKAEVAKKLIRAALTGQ